MKKIFLQMPNDVFNNNRIFTEKDDNNALARWRVLKEKLFALGYDFVTTDNNNLEDCEGIIFHDANSMPEFANKPVGIKAFIKGLFGLNPKRPKSRDIYTEALKAGLLDKMFLLTWEARAICADNFTPKVLDKFNHVITWDDDLLLQGHKFIRYWKPMEETYVVENPIPFQQKKFLVNISFNKHSSYKYELYSEREKLAWYCETHCPQDFDLYGLRWNEPVTRAERLFPFLVKKFTTFRGRTKDKIETLSKYKFNVAYENTCDSKGDFADRIFSAFQAKSVPVYWGPPNVDDYIDSDAFIDRRKFKNSAELVQFLKNMTEKEYNAYIEAIERFMQNDKYALFKRDNFCNTIIKALNLKSQ